MSSADAGGAAGGGPAERPCLGRAAVRELDRRAIEEYGIPSLVLMENAGRACADAVPALRRGAADAPVLCLCGAGNNGGDGLVIARTLVNRGIPAEVVAVATEERLAHASADLGTQLRLWRGLGRAVEHAADAASISALGPRLARASLLVDALFGTGLDRPLRSPFRELVELVNASGAPVLAVDVPSGLDVDTGAALGGLVRATATVTFVATKPGLLVGAGRTAAGRVSVAEIGIPRAWIQEEAARSRPS